MDEKARERLLNQLRCYLLDVADHVTEYGTYGTVLVNDIASKAMAAIDGATAPQWIRVTPETMPPIEDAVILAWDDDIQDWVMALAQNCDAEWIRTNVRYYWATPPLPPPPSEAVDADT